MTIKPPRKLPDNLRRRHCKHGTGQLADATMCWLAWMVLCQATISISGYISLDIGELLSSDLWPPSRIEASKVDYDPDLAEFALDFAAASYAPDPTGCLSRHNATLIKRVTIPCDFLGNECWAYIAKSEEWIIMAIRGTVEIKQLLAEVAESAIAPKVEFPAGGNVQHYFYTSFDDLWDGANFRGIIQNLKKDNPNYKILFTGHSFGGAVASLASAMFVHENLNLKNLTKSVFSITFGQPRVGNHAYAIAHDKLVPNSWRIVHRKDIVPHIPLCLSFMGHCTTGFNLTPYHHGTEIWYPESNSTTHQTCSGFPLNEGADCSNQYLTGFNIDDHEFYLGKDVSHHGNTKCGL